MDLEPLQERLAQGAEGSLYPRLSLLSAYIILALSAETGRKSFMLVGLAPPCHVALVGTRWRVEGQDDEE